MGIVYKWEIEKKLLGEGKKGITTIPGFSLMWLEGFWRFTGKGSL